MELLSQTELPGGFGYPPEFMKIVNQGLVDLDPWVVLEGDYLKDRFKGVRERYKGRKLIPFARRLDNDDLACWDMELNDRVVEIHDFASEGWEQRKVYNTFWDWFKKAVDDMIEHDQ
jgi:hypothetical protein